jgi:hypothetical protein
VPVKRRTAAPSVGDYVNLDESTGDADNLPEAVDEVSVTETEDRDETPRNSAVVQAGWKAGTKQRESGGAFAQDFKLSDNEQLIAFLEDGPYAVYQEHWVERPGKKSFVCIGTGCPLCRIGDSPRKKWCFNIAVLDEDGAELKSLTAGARLFVDLEKKNNDPKRGPLTKGYWSIIRTGGKAGWTTTVSPVSPRLLEEDWSVSEDTLLPAIAELTPYTSAIVKIPSKADLKLVADEIDED